MFARLPWLLVLIALAGGAARADVVQEAPTDPRPGIAFGGRFVGGPAGQMDGPSGWVGRLEYEFMPVFPARRADGALLGFGYGFEYWRSGTDHWGLSMPMPFFAGARFSIVRAMIGGGVDIFLIDQVADDTGVGFLAPFGLANLALDLRGVQVGVDARYGYRWQIDADDHARWQLGFFVGFTGVPRGSSVY